MLSLLEHMYHELDLVKEFNMNPITLKRWLVSSCKYSLYSVKSENFARISFLRIKLKYMFAMLNNSRLVHDLPTSVKTKVISQFREDFIFVQLREYIVSRK